jgi:hypothetical protein
MDALQHKKLKKIRSSVFFLIAANIVPLIGVLFFEWDIINILYLYWLESCVIGFYNALKIVTAKIPMDFQHIYSKVFSFIFFSIHYPAMMWLLMAAGINLISTIVFNRPLKPYDILAKTWTTIVAFLISHGYSFVHNYLLEGERIRVRIGILSIQPYLRIFVMWVVLMGGAFFILKYRQPVFLIVILIVMKIIVDCIAHYRERKKFSQDMLEKR